ncbi:unnamed protein product [Mesocestoides corti]|nr:unnamed protein product [Mesocestoides corti]
MEYVGDLIKNIVRSERVYYRQLIQYSLQQMMLFPYHLQRKIVAGLRITPFEYYKIIVHRTMLSELSYDRIPNFTAADCYQTLGIGRNEYIDLLNVYKGKLCSSRPNTPESSSSILDELLPKYPLNCKHLEPWFIVRTGAVSVDDVRAQTHDVQAVLDRIIDNCVVDEGNIGSGLQLSEIPIDIFRELYRQGLIYVDVPIRETDCLFVPTLDGFIMNRVTGDSCETMLYKIFLSIDAHSSVSQLAADLGVGTQFVINAASLFVRLGFAQRVEPPPHKPSSEHSEDTASLISDPASAIETKKVAFIFDSTITAYLMLGNLSADLKKHSVTMFEVGKLTGDSLSAFYRELASLSYSAEQDVGVYYEHAKCLGQTIRHISGALTPNEIDFRWLDLVRCGSLGSLEPATRARILSKNYSLLYCMAPLSYEASRLFGNDWPLTVGPPVAEISSPWFRLFVAHAAGIGDPKHHSSSMPALLLCRGTRVTRLPRSLSCYSHFLVTSWGNDPVVMDVYTLFYSINDLTMNTHVFIQAYDDREKGTPLHQHFLPLPISNEFLSKNGSRLPWLNSVQEEVDLTSLVGYLSLLLPDGMNEVDSESDNTMGTVVELSTFGSGNPYQQNTSQFLEHSVVDPRVVLSEDTLEEILDASRPICLLNLHLGIPLFNSALNDAVFANLSRRSPHVNLLSPEMRERLAAANKSLQDRLRQFIEFVGGVYVSGLSATGSEDSVSEKILLASPLPMPSKSICWSLEGQLEEWDN